MDDREPATDDREPARFDPEAHWRSLTQPMPRLRALLAYEDEFVEEESDEILHCVLPEQMEDKWIVLHDDGTLNIHRSWTGFHIYSVVLEPFEGPTGWIRCRPVETWVNRDPEQWKNTDDAFDIAIVRWLIRVLVLGQELPFPDDPAASGDDALLSSWGLGGSAAFPGADAILNPDSETGPASDAGVPPDPD